MQFGRWSTVLFPYCLLGGDTVAPSGLLARLCHAFLVSFYFTCANGSRYIGTKTGNIYGRGSGQIWLDDVQCDGSETSIAECPHNGWAVHNCQHNDDVAVSCTTGMVPYTCTQLPASECNCVKQVK